MLRWMRFTSQSSDIPHAYSDVNKDLKHKAKAKD